MIRLELRVLGDDGFTAQVDLFINGGKVTACPLYVRIADIVPFILQIDPERITVFREQVSSTLFHRLAGFRNTYFY